MQRAFLWALVCGGALLLCGCGPREQESVGTALLVKPGQSLQEIVDRAPSGAVIRLAPGTWRENLRLTKSLTLQGASPEATVLEGQSPGQPVVGVSGEVVVELKNLSLKGGHGGYAGPALSPAGLLAAGQAQVNLERVEIVENSGAGIVARDAARVAVAAATLAKNNRYGVEVWGQAQVTLRDTRFLANKMGGAWVDEQGFLQAEATTFEENLGPGIWARGQSRIHLVATEVRGNQGSGIHAQDTAALELRSCRIDENREYGVYLAGDSIVAAYDTSFQGNWYGLYLVGGQVMLEGCSVRANAWDGMRLRGSAVATVRHTEMAQGQGSGVAVVGQAQARLEFNRIRGFAVAGVYAFSASPVEGEGNELEGNGAHILGWVVPHLRKPTETPRYEVLQFPHPDFPTLQAAVDAVLPGGILQIAGGTHEAAVVLDKPLEIHAAGDAILRGQAAGPVISLVAGGKLRLWGGHLTGGSDGLTMSAGSSAELVGCWIWENTVGLRLWHDAQLVATRVSISRHPQGGLWAWNESQALLEEATFYANESCGIGAGGSAHVRVLRSTFVENAGQAAVLLLDQAQADLRDNVFSRNKGYGVDVVPGFAGKITGGGNVFEDNWRGAVRLSELRFLGE